MPDYQQHERFGVHYLRPTSVLEHLRHELLGRNSFGEQEPHPHSSCAASIVETGRVQPFPSEFEEGLGYKPRQL